MGITKKKHLECLDLSSKWEIVGEMCFIVRNNSSMKKKANFIDKKAHLMHLYQQIQK